MKKNHLKTLPVVWFAMCLYVLPLPQVKAADTEEPERMTAGVLFFEDKLSDPDKPYWQHLSCRVLTEKLRHAKSIRVLSNQAIKFGYRQIGKQRGQAIDAAQAGKLGELIEARKIVFGSYQFKDNKWHLEAFVLNTASEKVSKQITAQSADFFDAAEQIVKKVLDEIGVKATEKELANISGKWTTDKQALDYCGKGLELYESNGSLSKQEEFNRKAIDSDEQFSFAYIGLMAALGSQGKFDELESVIEKALQIDPENKEIYQMSGMINFLKDDFQAAEKHLKRAMSLDEDYSQPLIGLGHLCMATNKVDDAISYYKKAIAVDAFDADTYSSLALAYAHKRQRKNAVKQLLEVERLDPEKAMNTNLMVFQTYFLLGDLPKAAEYGERVIQQAIETGTHPQMIQGLTKKVEKIKASLTPVYLTAEMPTKYSAEHLQTIIADKLTKDEQKLVVYPLKSNKDIDQWALKLTKGIESDFDKAKAIFDAMLYRIQPGSFAFEHTDSTAEEVFAEWDDPDRKFICQELAKLYVALARAAKLEAFCVSVQKRYDNNVISHLCAGVFLDGKLLLVDPSYKWFGVPHKEFAVLNDLQMVAAQLSQDDRSSEKKEALCRIALKLDPDSRISQTNLAAALIGQNKWKQAEKTVNTAIEQNSDNYHNYVLAGRIELHNGNIEEAEKLIRKSIGINPENSMSRFMLGRLLGSKGQLRQARDEFRTGLRCEHLRAEGEGIRKLIVKIIETLGSESEMANKDL